MMLRSISVTVLVLLTYTTVVYAQGSCIFNSTHCSCTNVQHSGTCLRNTEPGRCRADSCSAGFACDCSGSSICSISSCSGWAPSDSRPVSSLTIGETVNCVEVNGNSCLQKTTEIEVQPVSEPPEYRMVQFGSATPNTMFNMTTFEDTGDALLTNTNFHGLWRNAELLRHHHITIRRYQVSTGEQWLCGIHGTFGVNDDGTGRMTAHVVLKGVNGQIIEWTGCDDPGECVGTSGNELEATLGQVNWLTDGWCIKPLTFDGNAVSIKYDQLEGFEGIVFQSPGGFDKIYNFVGGSALGMTGTIQPNGLVTGGALPEIIINLSGIEVPF